MFVLHLCIIVREGKGREREGRTCVVSVLRKINASLKCLRKNLDASLNIPFLFFSDVFFFTASSFNIYAFFYIFFNQES